MVLPDNVTVRGTPTAGDWKLNSLFINQEIK